MTNVYNENLEHPNFIGPKYIEDLMKQTGAALVADPRILERLPITLTYLSDNGGYPDLAATEIEKRLYDFCALLSIRDGQRPPKIVYRDIPSQDVYAASFDVAQLSRDAVRGLGNIIFVNCAPRKRERGNHENNQGEHIFVSATPNGTIVAATGEDAFLFFRDLIETGAMKVFPARVATKGSQFRSRDFFPAFSMQLSHDLKRFIDATADQGKHPDAETFLRQLAYVDPTGTFDIAAINTPAANAALTIRVDTHGNLKQWTRHEEFVQRFGKDAEVTIYKEGAPLLDATIVNGSFDKKEGSAVISAGSSGHWPDSAGKIMSPFAEIFIVGGRARDALQVSDKDLRDGIPLHIVPTELVKQALNQLYSANTPEKNERVALIDGPKILEMMVQSGLVNGLESSKLETAVKNGKLKSILSKHPQDHLVYKFAEDGPSTPSAPHYHQSSLQKQKCG